MLHYPRPPDSGWDEDPGLAVRFFLIVGEGVQGYEDDVVFSRIFNGMGSTGGKCEFPNRFRGDIDIRDLVVLLISDQGRTFNGQKFLAQVVTMVAPYGPGLRNNHMKIAIDIQVVLHQGLKYHTPLIFS